MSRKDKFAKVLVLELQDGMIVKSKAISVDKSDLQIIKSVLKINFVLRNRLGISLKEDSAIEMFLEFIEKIGKFTEYVDEPKKV